MEKKTEWKTSSGVSVTSTRPDGTEVTSFYPLNVASGEIVVDSTNASQIRLEPAEEERMIQIIDYIKSEDVYSKEFELSMTWEKGFKFKIKREPKKTVRFYTVDKS